MKGPSLCMFFTLCMGMLCAATAHIRFRDSVRKASIAARQSLARFEIHNCTVTHVDAIELDSAAVVACHCSAISRNITATVRFAKRNETIEQFRHFVSSVFPLWSTCIVYDGQKCCKEELFLQKEPDVHELAIYEIIVQPKLCYISILMIGGTLLLLMLVEGVAVAGFQYSIVLSQGLPVNTPGVWTRRFYIALWILSAMGCFSVLLFFAWHYFVFRTASPFVK